jgi:hypothetical protein
MWVRELGPVFAYYSNKGADKHIHSDNKKRRSSFLVALQTSDHTSIQGRIRVLSANKDEPQPCCAYALGLCGAAAGMPDWAVE